MWPGKHAQERPEHVAYVMASTGEAVTYRELNDRSNQLAQCFYDAGLRFGDHIAVLMENRPEFFEVCWAAQRSGLYYTCINWHFNAEETAYILDDCDAQVLVISDTFRDLAAELARQDAQREDAPHGRRPDRRLRLLRGDPRPLPGRAARRGARGHADALLVGHDRPAEGRALQDPPPDRRRPAARDGDDDDGVAAWTRTPCTSRPRRCTTRRRSSTA